ncbi:unnamed protein product [Paramecium primaurelia]|uniref:LITAF domain-containing protein n=1 Tax=Paramecium primaurelia TaxID=5886 RepID=A0A8S1M348_PARPR|nr:unnamed protein product [Paramecium primaurelia]
MQQDTNTTFEIADGQQQYQAPLQPQTQQVVYTQPMNTYQSQPQYPPPPINPQQNIIVQGAPYQVGSPPGQQELIVVNAQLGNTTQSQILCNQSRFPILMTCPYCQKQGTTRIDFQAGSGTWCCCFILFLFICCICWVPFVADGCRDANHMCPSCGQLVGSCPYKVCG